MDSDALDARAAEWGRRLAEVADELEAMALEWRLSPEAEAELPMGVEEAARVDPTSAYALPHAAAVMDVARRLRTIAAEPPVAG